MTLDYVRTNIISLKYFKMGDLKWSPQQQSLIFSAFYWSGLVSAFACAWLANMLGSGRLLLAGTVVNCLGSFVTPVSAVRGGPIVLLVVRFVMGLGQVRIYFHLKALCRLKTFKALCNCNVSENFANSVLCYCVRLMQVF